MFSIARAPLRVSFFGGGTDYPEYFEREPGAVLGCAIDRYIYISGSPILWLANYKYRIGYSKVEHVNDAKDIEHPVVRESLLRYYNEPSLDMSVFSDIPARTGLGSSSTFTVCMLKLLSHMAGENKSPMELARLAHAMEHDILKERVGVQDQLHAAFGGINRFDFYEDKLTRSAVNISGIGLEALSQSLCLVYTNTTRSANAVLKDQIENTTTKKIDKDLSELYAIVGQAARVLEIPKPNEMLIDLGLLLQESWAIKKKCSGAISNAEIDDLYELALKNGALGGKLCGAGSGGFMAMIVPTDKQDHFIKAMGENRVIQVGIDQRGACILQHDPRR